MVAEAFRQLVNVLPGAPGHVTDARERVTVDQVGADAVERDRGAQAAIFDARGIRHPDQQPGYDFEGEDAGFLAGVEGFDEEGIIIGFHRWIWVRRHLTPGSHFKIGPAIRPRSRDPIRQHVLPMPGTSENKTPRW